MTFQYFSHINAEASQILFHLIVFICLLLIYIITPVPSFYLVRKVTVCLKVLNNFVIIKGYHQEKLWQVLLNSFHMLLSVFFCMGFAFWVSSSCSTYYGLCFFESLSSSHNMTFVHYNVQSIFSKLEILNTVLIDFDILAFSETWLSASVDNDDLFSIHITFQNRKSERMIIMVE